MSEAVADLSLVRLVKIEERILGAEDTGLRARWEFGHELLAHHVNRNGRLRHGLASELGIHAAELNRRKRFAQLFGTPDELDHAMSEFGSWYEVVHRGLPPERDEHECEGDAPLPEGVYRTIAADPPWQYGNTATRAAAQGHYPTMSLDELCALPVEGWAADEAHLYLWTTNGFLREAFDVLDAWGFTYKTTLTWVKPQLGIGNYFRSSTEHILFGIRGGLKTIDSNQFNWFQAKRGRHSQKPQRFFELVETCSPGPFLEMFSRARRLGWDAWGNEV